MNNEPMNPNENPSGTPPTKRCPRCGRELPADSVFCGECGANLSGAPETFTVPPQSAPAVDTTPLKTSDFLILHLLNMIPLVGLILMLMWSFSDNVNLNRKNFCRAYLIMYAISFVLSILFVILYVIILGALFSSGAVMSDTILDPFGMIFH
ncbi:MAG: zinc ribbon domain-containing protein [Ruminococcaceae bacterium]|nr:zinc ribbon domain-containing protein [Oscillospiraceae bacterium]